MTSGKGHTTEVFISYRRKSWAVVHLLQERLKEHIKGNIFVDYISIDDTDFEKSILRHLRESNIVLVVVTELTFAPDRISNEDDWVRREIALALKLNKPIVLILVDNYQPPHPSKLPKDIRDITRKQGIAFYQEYFDAGVLKLVTFVNKVLASVTSTKEESTPIPATRKSEPQSSTSQIPLIKEKPSHQSQQENLQETPYDQRPMNQTMRMHHQQLEEIRRRLNPGKLSRVLNTDVEVYRDDISSIFDYLEEMEVTEDTFNYITSLKGLKVRLSEIMLELQTALSSWNTSNEVGVTASQRSEAFNDYMKHLNKCYGLLKDALDYFKSSKQGNLQENPLTQIPLNQTMRMHHQQLEEIRRRLNPGKLSRVLNTDVEVYRDDISSIFDYLEEMEVTEDTFNYITSLEGLKVRLSEIMLELQTALSSWNTSNEVGMTTSEKSEAFNDYMKHLNKCYGLLKDALLFFRPGN